MAYFIVNHRCNGCLACLQNCPAKAIDFKDADSKRSLLHNMARCARCGNCWRICPQQAIEFQHMMTNQWDEVAVMDILHCRVCNEPLYTAAFLETLSEKLDVLQAPLCSRHKDALQLKIKTHFPGLKTKS